MQCREGFSTRADLQYPNELYTLAVNGSSDDPNKALHGFPFGRVTFTYHQVGAINKKACLVMQLFVFIHILYLP